MHFAGASTTHRVARDRAMTPQTQMEAKLGGGFAGRTNKLVDACMVNSQHTPRARNLFYSFQPTLIPTTLHL
ncbi:hypothetical protein BGW80DRAFT_1327663, partial [Lactifluus volemus]